MKVEQRSAEISPQVVRDVAGAKSKIGDFRSRFSQAQPELDQAIEELLDDGSDLGVSFARGLSSALWAMYCEHLGREIPMIEQGSLQRFLPVARQLLERLYADHEGEDFDPEWLAELPRGAQPHLMGFLLGALRAARFNLSSEVIFETAVLLFAIAGALEGAAAMLENSTSSDRN
jgi:hypothetical protein